MSPSLVCTFTCDGSSLRAFAFPRPLIGGLT
jgi:hypothetical protein